jgi:predicted nucleic acid-binding protein
VRAVDAGLLAVAVNRWAPEHARAARWLEELVNGDSPWALPWSVAHEFLELVTHPHTVARPLAPDDAASVLELLLASPGVHPLAPTRRHAAVVREVLALSPREPGLPPGLETAALLREHGVHDLFSLDPGMKRYRFLRVTNPLRSDVAPESSTRRYRVLRPRRSPGQ